MAGRDRAAVNDQHGRATLILADISGYTRFLDDVATAHEKDIATSGTPPAYPLMTTLLDAIIGKLTPPFIMAKLEGDAVFAYADDESLDLRGEAVRACLRECYRSFRDHLKRTALAMTCSCSACSTVATLDLKFVLHHGSYFAQTIAGSVELLGPDVTLVHQMLKNEVSRATGWPAYALMTDLAADYLEISRTIGRDMTLRYDAARPIDAYVLPLA